MIKFDTTFHQRNIMLEKMKAQAKVGRHQKLRHIRPVKDGISYQMYVGGKQPWQSKHLSNERIAEILEELG